MTIIPAKTSFTRLQYLVDGIGTVLVHIARAVVAEVVDAVECLVSLS